MRSARLSWWLQPLAILAAAAFVILALRPGWLGASIIVAVGVIIAWRLSPARHTPGPTHAEAQHRAHADGAIVVYWRPGCMFCARLRRSLGKLSRDALWVNIWADADAAAFVRGVNDGNEIVPTVVLGSDAVVTNPEPERVRQALASIDADHHSS